MSNQVRVVNIMGNEEGIVHVEKRVWCVGRRWEGGNLRRRMGITKYFEERI